MSYNFEIALRQYIAAFKGNDISPTDFKTRFDNLVHKDFTFVSKDEMTLTREEVYEREVQKFTSGVTKITLIHFRKIGLGCIDVKLGLVTGDEEHTIRIVSSAVREQGSKKLKYAMVIRE